MVVEFVVSRHLLLVGPRDISRMNPAMPSPDVTDEEHCNPRPGAAPGLAAAWPRRGGGNGRTAWAAAVMAIYWATEVIDPHNSLMPIVLFPALGVMRAEHAQQELLQGQNCPLLWGACRRCGTRGGSAAEADCAPRADALWCTPTSAAARVHVLDCLHLDVDVQHGDGRHDDAYCRGRPPAARLGRAAAERCGLTGRTALHQPGKALVLSIAYAANIGGLATLTGTGPNLVLAGDVVALYPDAPGIGFAAWMAFALPLASVLLLCAWGLFVCTLLRGVDGYQPSRMAASSRRSMRVSGRSAGARSASCAISSCSRSVDHPRAQVCAGVGGALRPRLQAHRRDGRRLDGHRPLRAARPAADLLAGKANGHPPRRRAGWRPRLGARVVEVLSSPSDLRQLRRSIP